MVDKLLSKTVDLLNNGSSICSTNKLVSYLLNNLTTSKKHKNLQVLLSDLENLLNNLKKYQSVFESEFKASIILFCMRNKLIYLNCLRKFYPRKNRNSLKFMLDHLRNKGILRRVNKREFLKDRQIFNHFVIRSGTVGIYQIKKIKFYTLTDDALHLFSMFEKKLEMLSNHSKLINNFKRQLAQSHKQLEKKAKLDREKKKLLKEKLKKQKHLEKWHELRDNLVKQFKTKNQALNLLDHAKKDNPDFKKEITGFEQTLISTGFNDFMRIWRKKP